LPSKPHWSTQFSLTPSDIDALIADLLEGETPLPADVLARRVIELRLERDAQALADRYADLLAYDPTQTYKKGQTIAFQGEQLATGVVTAVESGLDPAGFCGRSYGKFKRMTVDIDGETATYAAGIAEGVVEPSVSDLLTALPGAETMSLDDIMEVNGAKILASVNEALQSNPTLVRLAGKWFVRDLMQDVTVGHLNLAEAVLDIAEGGPLTTAEILEQIGGLGDSPQELQEFSLNYAMNEDERFDEVGPAGEVLWYLKRQEPAEVREKPALLRYTRIDYNRDLLTADMLALEAEVDDELSPFDTVEDVDEATVRLIYAHRRLGTIPLNSHTRAIFPTARRAPRINVTLVDAHDGETYSGWVVNDEQYVYGAAEIYRKYHLPLGAQFTVHRSSTPGHIVIAVPTFRPRVEYVSLMSAKDDRLQFDLQTRHIGAKFDEQMILGIDELAPIEALAKSLTQQKKNLSTVLKLVIPALARLSPQGAAHAKTIYSAVNVLRRCPPGVVLATLEANRDFENVADHYWKLSDA